MDFMIKYAVLIIVFYTLGYVKGIEEYEMKLEHRYNERVFN